MSTYSSVTPDRLRKATKTIIYAADQIEGLLRLADKDRGRIAELEAALREIAELHRDPAGKGAEIAACALKGKP